jgi:hypothetical protein
MRVLPSVNGLSASADPVEALAVRAWATGAGARSLCALPVCLCDAAFAGERR